MAIVYQRPHALLDVPTHYCPGCTHGVIHKLVAEVIDELGIEGNTVGVVPVGCSVMAYDYFACDAVEAPHGRAPAVATGLKRAIPTNVVFTYQGDGDLAAIGTAETVHSATRGENITVIFVNNGIYGMTGGQMAPTTLPGQVTQTTPYGRDTDIAGYPIRVCEMLSTLSGVAYAERVAVDSVPNIKKAKAAIKKAFTAQIEGKGFSIVEVLSTCPTNWGFTPVEAIQWLRDNMMPYYPLGVYMDRTEEGVKHNA
ncbi:thiamine pyrophosphate-dependent enzyme [Marasmitruncus massiliensis]|uniref:thiamine pyrophosphate-dependent enzyme n=1 Tax=Marasmitruncus massiliensis TaxID=1944642 RepID=UPI000C7D542C|nr:thiamine pyrophosphate-dependent enzyme [Marasmitruncus massiliensis]